MKLKQQIGGELFHRTFGLDDMEEPSSPPLGVIKPAFLHSDVANSPGTSSNSLHRLAYILVEPEASPQNV